MLFPKTFVAFYSDLLIPTLGDYRGFPGGSDGEESACNAGDLDWEEPLKKGMATHFSVLAWRIPWTEESGRLQSMGSQELDVTELLSRGKDSRLVEP